MSAFYNKTFDKATSRLEVLHSRYGGASDGASDLDAHEIEEFAGALLELRTELRNLQWFGEINRRGFVKITKKFDKKVPGASVRERYVSSKVDTQHFAKGDGIPPVLSGISLWLSALKSAQNATTAKSNSTYSSLAKFCSRAKLSPSEAQLVALDQSIRDDDASLLQITLEEVGDGSGEAKEALLHNLLQRSVSAHSRSCITFALEHVQNIQEPLDVNYRNCVHRLIIHIGQTKLTSEPKSVSDRIELGSKDERLPLKPQNVARTVNGEDAPLLDKKDDDVQILVHLLDHIQPRHRSALFSKDYSGKLPLHYAAQYGFVLGCEILTARMRDWGLLKSPDSFDALELQDNEGFAPFHLSAIGGHALAMGALLKEASSGTINGAVAKIKTTSSQTGRVLSLATKSNYKEVVRMLVRAGVDINWTDRNGESALHVAARYGHHECARILMEGTESQHADPAVVENLYEWTPLHVAAIDGHIEVVSQLMTAGVDVSRPDSSGWTAKEHAALRGHMDIARLLAPYTHEEEAAAARQQRGSPPLDAADRVSIEGPRSDSMNGRSRSDDVVKTVGHRYLTDESLILVSLGSLDMRKDVEVVNIDRTVLTESYATQLDTALSIIVSADGAKGESAVVDLPAQENISTEPVVFTTKDILKVRLLFDLVPTYARADKTKFGRAVALLSSLQQTVGSRRTSMQGDVCVPVVSNSFDIIGTVSFSFRIITPFSHPNMERASKQTYWKKLSSTMLIGHRGLGKNMTSNRSLQLGENTLTSFIAAANLGAQYVEFDVQLTKDHVPVIYHDFLVSETGIDAPVHTLTLEQFLHINPDSSRTKHEPSAEQPDRAAYGQRTRAGNVKVSRSRSLGFAGDGFTGIEAMDERMKHTKDFKKKGFKANSRGNFIQAPFATLEDLFRKLPEEIGFNIEMKYPMLHETEEQEMDSYAVELNSFCDTVLSKVYDLAGNRHIIFSSFNPDVCLCLSFKQPSIPILFLTNAGCDECSDVRASSLQEAIRFASRWNLLGLVSTAEPLINSPRLVRVVKENGLVCVSYGTMNNDPELVQASTLVASPDSPRRR